MTTKFCVVGSPISHSLSPVLHMAAAEHLGLDVSFEAIEVSSGNLAEFLEQNDYQGVSVTMPLKVEAFDIAIERSEAAILTKVANTLTRGPAGWSCANTDVFGLTKSLGQVPEPSNIVIVGSGATTISALTALASVFPNSRIQILARSQDSANTCKLFGESLGLDARSGVVSAESIAAADLVLSLVPSGSFSTIWAEISALANRPQGWLFDVSYNPWPSIPASAWGTERVISGLEMLIWQATEQVEIFSRSMGRNLVVDKQQLYSVMKAAVSSK